MADILTTIRLINLNLTIMSNITITHTAASCKEKREVKSIKSITFGRSCIGFVEDNKHNLVEYSNISCIELSQDNSLVDFVLNLDFLTTKEFCNNYNIAIPSWQGDTKAAAIQFMELDAIKLKLIIEEAKKLKANKKF